MKEGDIMTYQEMFTKVKELMKDADASKIVGHVALQFNVEGEGEGIFYAEVSEGVLSIEPYDYRDYDAKLLATAEVFLSVLSGEKDAIAAYTTGALRIEGNLEKALVIKELVDTKKGTKKATAKKATATKKTATKKAAVKTTAAKTAETKTAAAKTTTTKATTAKTAATRATTAKTTAAKTTPAKATAAKTTPAKATAAKTTEAKATPAKKATAK